MLNVVDISLNRSLRKNMFIKLHYWVLITTVGSYLLCGFREWSVLLVALTTPSQPQQLSTYALTLFKHKTQVGDQEVHVGESVTLLLC